MSNRTDWVDYAKAIGIILVVYGHVARGLFNAGIEVSEELYRLVDSVVYSFHMPLFFFLSGLFFHQSFFKRGAVGLTLNKIDTIVYPYLVWSLLQGGVEAFLSDYTNGSVEFSQVLSLWEPRAQFWFLYALFFVFVTCCAIFYFSSEKYIAVIFIIACILYISRGVLPNVMLLSFIVNNLVYFLFGLVFTKYDLSKVISSHIALLTLSIIFILSQYLIHGYFGNLHTDKGVESLLLACVSILFIVSLSISIARVKNRLLAYIGASSMAIYLMHILAGSGVRVILSKILLVDSFLVHLIVGCIAAILLPLFALEVINRMKIPYIFSAPISRWLKFSYNKALQRRAVE